jgi:AcrR family transcriptional regulator
MIADIDFHARVFGESAETDERVIDGALAAFLDFGVKRTSIGEIARRAKVSPATLYRKFPSKNAVVEAVGLREARRFVKAAEACVDPTASGADQVVDCFAGFARTLTANPLLKRLIDTEPEAVLPHLTTEGGPILSVGRMYLAAFIRRLQDENKLPAFDADEVGELCARLALSFALTPDGVLQIDDEASARRYARTHITALMRLPVTDTP